MGAVYKARQRKLDRFVALKILSSDLAEDPAFAERFHREARVLARLNHQHIVSVFDFGTQGPFWYLLMEYVDGVNLREAMQAGAFTPGDCLALVQDICAALKFAHDEGILHRDVKPENVLLDSRGRVKIADFGLAKLVGKNERDDITLTRQGAVMGTLHYMAPEQLETPQDIDQRADIYSLGVVFYELLTGELPIGRFAPPSDKSPLDPRVDDVVMRALERKREQRYQNVGEVKTEVEAISQSHAEGANRKSDTPSMTENPYESANASSFPPRARATRWLIWSGIASIAMAAVCVVAIVFRMLVAFNSSATSSATDLAEGISVAILPSLAAVLLGILGIVLLIAGFVVRQSVRTSPPPVVKPPGPAPETARFATASAILTGISVLLAVTVVIMLIAVASVKPEPNQARFMGAYLGMLGALGFVIVSVPAFLGISLGAKALGEIRQSGGRKASFGSAIFGVLAWPVLLPIAVTGILIYLSLPDGPGPNDPMGPGRNLPVKESSGVRVRHDSSSAVEAKPAEEPAIATSTESGSSESDQLSRPEATGLGRDSEAPDASSESSRVNPADRDENQ
jgi:tRNA A-37 threonylcarbamoyl transferase component Bud32